MGHWLITWDWMGDHGKVENEVAAILNYRFSPDTVSNIIELLYANNFYSLTERVAYAKNMRNNPYPARRTHTGIYCGYNPFLCARPVDDLRVHVNEKGEETLTWREGPKQKPLWMKLAEMDEAQKRGLRLRGTKKRGKGIVVKEALQ